MTEEPIFCVMCTRRVSEDEWPICPYCDADLDEIINSEIEEELGDEEDIEVEEEN